LRFFLSQLWSLFSFFSNTRSSPCFSQRMNRFWQPLPPPPLCPNKLFAHKNETGRHQNTGFFPQTHALRVGSEPPLRALTRNFLSLPFHVAVPSPECFPFPRPPPERRSDSTRPPPSTVSFPPLYRFSLPPNPAFGSRPPVTSTVGKNTFCGPVPFFPPHQASATPTLGQWLFLPFLRNLSPPPLTFFPFFFPDCFSLFYTSSVLTTFA